MSRFFTGDSDSESESEEENNDEVQTAKPAMAGAQFIYDSSDSEEETRVVKTEKDKHWEAMQATIARIKNHLKINDWVAINTDYDILIKLLGKAKNVVSKEGMPKFLIKCVLDLDQVSKDQDPKSKEKGKKMSASNAKGVNTIRQKTKKFTKEYEKQVDAYKLEPLVSDEESAGEADDGSESDDDDDESEEEVKKAAPKKKAAKKDSSDEESASDEESDDDESDSDEDSGSDSNDNEEAIPDTPEDITAFMKSMGGNPYTRDFWTKKVQVDDSIQKAQDIEALIARIKPSYLGWEKDVDIAKDDAKNAPMYVDRTLKKIEQNQKLFVNKLKEELKEDNLKETKKVRASTEQVYTPELVQKKLKELQAMRGKRGTDRNKVVEDLKLLASFATTPVVMLKVKTTLTAALFDSTLNSNQYMPRTVWLDLHKALIDILEVLMNNDLVRLNEDEEVRDAFEDDEDGDFLSMDSLMEADEDRIKRMEEKRKKQDEERKEEEDTGNASIQYVTGNLYSIVQRVVAEFRSSLQAIDPHTPEYVTRLRDEKVTVDLVKATQEYYKKIEKPALERMAALLRLELVYYHYIPALDCLSDDADKKKVFRGCFPAPMIGKNGEESETHKLALFLYKSPDSREKMCALLCHVYHLALHNRIEDARNLLLMSHAQDTINEADIKTRILFNRTLAQVGLCYFRHGNIDHALNCLAELYQSNRIKELLAQGVSQNRYGNNDRDAEEKQKLERRRQYPYHMHINMDLLESVHLLSAMFLEVPNLAMHGIENKRRQISKTFRRQLEHHSSKAFNGPPENTRDLIMASTKALRNGDWAESFDNVLKLKMWKLMPNSDRVKVMMEKKVKEVALKTYLLTFGSQYASISVSSLTEMFELTEKEVYRSASQMIFSEQLHGSWDGPSKSLIMSGVKHTQLQIAALAYGEKAAQFLEQNERLMEQRYGFYTHKNPNEKKFYDGGYHNNRDKNQQQGQGQGESFGNFRRNRRDSGEGGNNRQNA